MNHFSSEEKLINFLSHKTPERQCWTLIQPLLAPPSNHLWRRDRVLPTQPGLEEHFSPCLSWNSYRFLPPFKKKQKTLLVLVSFLIMPTTTRMAFNNQLAFQLLFFFFPASEHKSRFPEERDAGRALGANQSNWLDLRLQLQVSLLLNLTFQSRFG